MPEVTDDHLRLAGMALAHAVWSIEDGETLCTMAMLQQGEERFLTRYDSDTISESIEDGLADLKERLVEGAYAALVYDGFYTPEDGERADALILELLAANRPGESANTASQLGRLVQQYRKPERSGFGPFGKRVRFALLGRPLVRGTLPPGAVDQVIRGALEHEKVRRLFQSL